LLRIEKCPPDERIRPHTSLLLSLLLSPGSSSCGFGNRSLLRSLSLLLSLALSFSARLRRLCRRLFILKPLQSRRLRTLRRQLRAA
jgi:hypothetical protein